MRVPVSTWTTGYGAHPKLTRLQTYVPNDRHHVLGRTSRAKTIAVADELHEAEERIAVAAFAAAARRTAREVLVGRQLVCGSQCDRRQRAANSRRAGRPAGHRHLSGGGVRRVDVGRGNGEPAIKVALTLTFSSKSADEARRNNASATDNGDIRFDLKHQY